ncbi:10781_t:CDS:2 [Paraglomus occultum]|uniref:10781_t:CDS:1 n=1 Tax=Paraglomus occultum TaxID=144539 RepID=A0A9N9G6A8_9GLOM|nr:10781_t:CDS:2 [Paraglomus occultum]
MIHHRSLNEIVIFYTPIRYASLFFVVGISADDNELITLEIIHRYVEVLDRYFGNVCELDLIFNFQKAYFILDELIIAGEMQESSKKSILRVVSAQDQLEDNEITEKGWPENNRIGLRG